MKKSLIIVVLFLTVSVAICIQSCSSGYETHGNKVYYNTWNEAEGKVINFIDGADAKTFKELKNSDYALDKNYVYYQQRRLKQADPKSFIIISKYFGKDSNHVYQEEKLVDKAEAKSFQLIGDGPYGKDYKDYYYDTIALGADVKTFHIFEEDHYSNWAKDANNYYLNGIKNPLADNKSFVKLNSNYARDKFNVYYRDTTITNADPLTFKVVADYEAEDKNFTYKGFQASRKAQ